MLWNKVVLQWIPQLVLRQVPLAKVRSDHALKAGQPQQEGCGKEKTFRATSQQKAPTTLRCFLELDLSFNKVLLGVLTAPHSFLQLQPLHTAATEQEHMISSGAQTVHATIRVNLKAQATERLCELQTQSLTLLN